MTLATCSMNDADQDVVRSQNATHFAAYTSDRTLASGTAPAVPATRPLNVAVTSDAQCRRVLSV